MMCEDRELFPTLDESENRLLEVVDLLELKTLDENLGSHAPIKPRARKRTARFRLPK